MRLSLAGPSYTARSVVAAAQQTMNLYAEAVEAPNEPARLTLYNRPGIKLFKQLTGAAKIRCLWAGGGRLFVVHGGEYQELHEDGTVTGAWPVTLAQTDPVAHPDWPFPDPAQIFSNGHQLLILSGGFVYCDNGSGPEPVLLTVNGNGNTTNSSSRFDATSGPAFTSAYTGKPIEIDGVIYTVGAVLSPTALSLTPAPPDAADVVWKAPQGDQLTGYTGGFLDGYFIVARPSKADSPVATTEDLGRNFNVSKLNDGIWWDPLDFGVKEGASDYIKSILCDHEELYVFGTETTEIWGNVGDPNFPFQRIAGAFIHEGSVATFACCSIGLSVCGLAGGAAGQTIAFQVSGLQPKRISTHAQESEWNAANFRVDDAVSYGYSEGGHTFWVVNFWQMQRTWVYDLTTGLWHERASWDGSNFTQYRPWYHCFIPEWGTNGKHIVGDPRDGKLYEMSNNYFDDDGAAIMYRRAFPHLIEENQFAYVHRMEVLAEMGALSGTDLVPQITLELSKDGGHTFQNPRSVFMGSSGDYRKRAVWRRLGKARDTVPRISIQAAVKIALVDAFVEATQGFA